MASESAVGASTVADVVRFAFGTDTARLLAHEPIVRIGVDPEGVHQARVATRRLRSHLSTFGPVLRKRATRSLARDLRGFGRALGSVRDLDVLRERFGTVVETFEPLARDDGDAILVLLDGDRAMAHATLRSVLDKSAHVTLLTSLASFAAAPPLRRDAMGPAQSFMLEAVQRRVADLEAAVLALPLGPPDEVLHRLRITAKPARYTAELAAALLGDDAARLGKRLAELCDVLGVLNDGARANQWLDVVTQDPSKTFAVALIRAREIERMHEARAGWSRCWERVRAAATDLGARGVVQPA